MRFQRYPLQGWQWDPLPCFRHLVWKWRHWTRFTHYFHFAPLWTAVRSIKQYFFSLFCWFVLFCFVCLFVCFCSCFCFCFCLSFFLFVLLFVCLFVCYFCFVICCCCCCCCCCCSPLQLYSAFTSNLTLLMFQWFFFLEGACHLTVCNRG